MNHPDIYPGRRPGSGQPLVWRQASGSGKSERSMTLCGRCGIPHRIHSLSEIGALCVDCVSLAKYEHRLSRETA